MMVDWGELMPDLLSTIATKLLYEDFTAFAGVCRSWRSVAVKNNFSPVQVPWLLLAPLEGSVSTGRDFYSLTKGGMVHTVQLPQAGGGKRLVSCLGWLITLDEDGDMELLHPLSSARISLPSAPEYNKFWYWLEKAALSASPSDTDDYTLMVLFRSILAYWKPGNTAWVTTVSTRSFSFTDVVFHSSGRFYATNCRAELFSVDIINSPDSTTITANLVGALPREVVSGGFYLAESGGHLLFIVRKLLLSDDNKELPDFGHEYVAHNHNGIGRSDCHRIKIYKYMTTSFRVYRLEPSTNNWHVVNELGGRSLFLSKNSAPVSIPCDVGTTIRPDCIYFIEDTDFLYVRKDDIGRRGIDMGVYFLKEERADTLFRGGTKGQRCLLCAPLWVIPSKKI